MAKTNFKTVDEYHSQFEGEVLKRLNLIRSIITKIVPNAEESISYQIPCFKYQGALIYYAAFPKHVSVVYPFSKKFQEHFKGDLETYKVSKAAIQLPLDQPLPKKLVERIISFRKKENEQSNDKNKAKAGNAAVQAYNKSLPDGDQEICEWLAASIDSALSDAENKIWHGHPVWFLDGNPIVGYSKQKLGIRLIFWSGADFGEPALNVKGNKFKDASIFYNHPAELKLKDLKRWLKKGRSIQWDYKNIVKRKGRLERLK